MLLHIKEDPTRPGFWKVEFASDTIRLLVIERFFRAKNTELNSFLNANAPERMVGQIKGRSCWAIHAPKLLDPALVDLEMRKLGGQSTYQSVTLPPLRHKHFLKLSMVDLTTIQVNDYYQPLIANFSAVDAIALMGENVFEGSLAAGFGISSNNINTEKKRCQAGEELISVHTKLRDLTKDSFLSLSWYLSPKSAAGQSATLR